MEVRLENLTKRFGDILAVDDVSLRINDGEFITLVGPSGCGKTTTLRCIAGLTKPSSGRIFFDDEDVTDTPPGQRSIAFVFQNYALYPHMTARRNISFALEEQGMTKSEIDTLVSDTADMLGIADQLDQKPGELSGGQKQRVALGRSIVRDPDVFLLDEPLSNLDAKLRVDMRAELQTLHRDLETTTIYVTHDQEEAMTMSKRIAVMRGGEIQQVGPPDEIYNQPRNLFVANFIGSPSMNFVEATVSDGRIDAGAFSIESPVDASADRITVGIRPEDLSITPDPSDGHAQAQVRVFEKLGPVNNVYLALDGGSDEIIAQIAPSVQSEPGETVGLSINTERVHLFDAEGAAIYNPPTYEVEPEGPDAFST